MYQGCARPMTCCFNPKLDFAYFLRTKPTKGHKIKAQILKHVCNLKSKILIESKDQLV